MHYAQGNQPLYEYTGIDRWHKAGYTGQGIKICVVDIDYPVELARFPDKIVKIGSSGNAFDPQRKGRATVHGQNSVDVVQQICPDAEIYFARYQHGLNRVVDHCITNDVDILTLSMSYGYKPITAAKSQEAVDAGILLMSSAGNCGHTPGDELRYPAGKSNWMAVGSAILNPADRTVVRASSSSTGHELEVMAFLCGFITLQGYDIAYCGTSHACPMLAGMFGLYRQKYGRVPKEDMRLLLQKHCMDLDQEGRDIMTGWGFFRLPNPETGERMREIVLQIDNNVAIVDGEPVTIDQAPYIDPRSDRTVVPLSFIGRQLGADVQWIPDGKKIIIRG